MPIFRIRKYSITCPVSVTAVVFFIFDIQDVSGSGHTEPIWHTGKGTGKDEKYKAELLRAAKGRSSQ